jgi:nucleoside-diphosphate-sugar epimerase
MTIARATIFGGSGFIGRHIVKRLAQRGIVVRAAVRDPEAALFLKPMGQVGQIAPGPGNYEVTVMPVKGESKGKKEVFSITVKEGETVEEIKRY